MDPKDFILILFCGHFNDIFLLEAEDITTESTVFGSSRPYVSANSQNTTGNPLSQPTDFNPVSSAQPISTAKVAAGHSTPGADASSEKPAAHTSAGQPLASNITTQPMLMANDSSRPTVPPVLTSARQLPPSAHTSPTQLPPFLSTSTHQPSSSHNSSGKPTPSTVHNPALQTTPSVKTSQRITPGFILETTSNTTIPRETNSNSIAAILVGVILTSMLVAIIMIVLWKCFRKPVSSDQNWAGRSPFADGETPDIYLDNFRENEAPTKRTSIVSLMPWKPSKNTLLADDLEIKLFESSEHVGDSNHAKTEKIKDQVNGTSEESAGGSTIGTAVSSSDDADYPPPPPLLDLEGQGSNQSDKPTMTIASPLPNDTTNLPPSLDCLNQVCEDYNPESEQSFPPPPDSSFHFPPAPGDFMESQQGPNNEIQDQEFSIPLDSGEAYSESLPPPPEDLL